MVPLIALLVLLWMRSANFVLILLYVKNVMKDFICRELLVLIVQLLFMLSALNVLAQPLVISAMIIFISQAKIALLAQL